MNLSKQTRPERIKITHNANIYIPSAYSVACVRIRFKGVVSIPFINQPVFVFEIPCN